MRYFPEYAIVGGAPVTLTDNTTLASSWVGMSTFDYVDFIVAVTDANSDTTIDAKLQSASDSSGTGAADITGLAITQFAADTDDQYAVLRVRATDLAAAGSDTHVGCTVTCGNGTTGANVAIIALGFGSDYAPATDYDIADVVEIKSL